MPRSRTGIREAGPARFVLTMTLPIQPAHPIEFREWKNSNLAREDLMQHEWLVANGLGGYASSTITGVVSSSST
jgi:hypothetical protein